MSQTCLSAGLLQVVKQCIRVPVFVMIRPRGGDFLYSDREVEVMKADIRLAKQHGADGLVFGALTEDGRVDTELCTALLGEQALLFKGLIWYLSSDCHTVPPANNSMVQIKKYFLQARSTRY